MKDIKSVIFGISGLSVTDEEREFFEQTNPLGFILFDRNVKDPAQLKELTADLRSVIGRSDAPILVDQEGGRVQRLWPPYWEGLPFGRTYGYWYLEKSPKVALKAVEVHAKKLADMLLDVGINVDCWPCFDVITPQVHWSLGKRFFSDDPNIVSSLGNRAVDTMLRNGLMPVVKHIPGYGKAKIDPHIKLPVVEGNIEQLETDFLPFRQVNKNVWGMTAHVLYPSLDDKKPATISRKVLNFVRQDIGFEGFLVCDDLCMGALEGNIADLAAECIYAGCDTVLHCNGVMEEMRAVAEVLPPLSDKALDRLQKAEKFKENAIYKTSEEKTL